MGKIKECQQTFVVKKTKYEYKRLIMRDKKIRDPRFLDRPPPFFPMPWMVLISIKGSQCEGTLINNEFVLTAANCFCGAAKLCDRMTMEVEENVVNKIRVRETRFH